ncbi:hypothetical protein KQ910_10980 [Reyranella sp. MMS21-HV4-11]|uniref:Uncharacterized protein n=1 Tax=Reyranella humidisoli TaxID=2849149 RepID=A0ABS6IM66_9HYPH|nr:hypothetical protein [Reyranella sp. MMS21-HV4-11]MBU8874290.1 hypothetical protein [Reyranella sp. MMS21-HV4-11]
MMLKQSFNASTDSALDRILDLSEMLSATSDMRMLGDNFQQAYRRRPTRDEGRWVLKETSSGLQPTPLLILGNATPLIEEHFGTIARRITSFLSSEFNQNRPPTPELHGSEGYGLLTDLEHMHLHSFFADPEKELNSILEKDLLPFMKSELGVTHLCVIRPNHTTQQSRLSFVKFFWACQAFGLDAVKEKILEDRTLDSILPSPQDMMEWIEVFFTFAPTQIALPIRLVGGYVVFFSSNPWIFPRASVAGMLGHFTSSMRLMTSDENTMIQGVRFSAGDPSRIYDYVRMSVEHINTLSWFSTNPFNFLSGERLEGREQIQFVTALHLLINDIRSANSTLNTYARMSFCLSAIDKLSNLIASRLRGKVSESDIFKACFSVRTIKRLRTLARSSHSSSNPLATEALARQLRLLLKVQKSIRDQVRGKSKEDERLDWLWSYRNLRHGTFLRQNQFERLFVDATGTMPSQLARGLMALLLSFATSPDAFFRVFEIDNAPSI